MIVKVTQINLFVMKLQFQLTMKEVKTLFIVYNVQLDVLMLKDKSLVTKFILMIHQYV